MTRADESPALRVLGQSRLVLDSLPRAVVVADLDGTILAVNSVAARAYGVAVSEAVGRSIRDFFSAANTAQLAGIVDRVRAGETWSGAVPVVQPDNTVEWAYAWVAPLRDDDGTVVGLIGASDEAQTELHVLQQRASDLSEHLVLALAAGELGTWRWDKVAGVIEWDATLERLFGLEPGTFEGTLEGWTSRLHPDDLEDTLATVERAVAHKSAFEIEHRVVWPDSSVHWMQGRGTVTLDRDGNVTGTVGCISDITPRKRLEIEATRRYSQAEEAVKRERVLRERLEFLAELNRVALAAHDYRELMRAVTAAAVPTLGDWSTLHFLPEPGGVPDAEVAHKDPDKVEWAAQMRQRFPWNPDAPAGTPAVIRTGRLEFLREVDQQVIEDAIRKAGRDDVRDEILDLLDKLQLTSVITVPLNTKRRTIGAMQFVSAESGRVYDHEDVGLAQAAAGRIAEALDNRWLTDQHRSIARKLQDSLLPPHLPRVDGLAISARYWAAGEVSEVGGDFYDVFAIDDNKWAVLIGDVCGTGPDAAAVTAIARHTVRAAATHGAEPSEVLTWLNDALHAGNRELFCTAAYLTLEPAGDGQWRYTSTSAGHPLPLLVNVLGETTTIGAPGMLVGAVASIVTTTVEGRLQRGDTVVLYTDGVTDVSPPHGIEPDALGRMVSKAAEGGVSAEDIAARLGEAIEEVLPIKERNDDVALLVVRVT